jgi:large subunit ribosomal protein L15
MKLNQLKSTPGSRKRRKLLGRGDGSGRGGTSGRGHKGDRARSGCVIRLHFEGGQNTYFRRLPKRGFKSLCHKKYNLVNIGLITKNFSAGESVNEEILREKGLIGGKFNGIKILGTGEIDKAVNVLANAFSTSAKAKIESAGGKCELLSVPAKKEKKAKE